jgi:putative acetyltransferase
MGELIAEMVGTAGLRNVRTRTCRLDDAEAITQVFRSAVSAISDRRYAPEQVTAWSASAADRLAFGAARLRGVTLVAEVEGSVVAFGQLHPEDHVEMLYCDARQAGRGIGARLLDELIGIAEGRGICRLTADVSLTARMVFERAGFRVIAEEQVVRAGVWLPRLRMERVATTG